MRKKMSNILGKVWTKPSSLHIQREPIPEILKRSVIVGIAMVILGGGLSAVSTGTTYVCQLISSLLA